MALSDVLNSFLITPSVLVGVLLLGALYAIGVRYMRRQGLDRHIRGWRIAAFYLGLLTLLVAVDSPFDGLADVLLWAHMLQHVVLVLVVAPLLLLGEPLMPVWRAVPRSARRASLGWVVRQGWPRRVWHAVSSRVFRPVPVLLLFVMDFTVWHIPSLYDLALANETIHGLEHMTFIGVALLLWAQVIPSRPLHPRLNLVGRIVYVVVVAMYSNVMGSIFIFSTQPFYPYYTHLVRSAGAPSALVDQHLAGTAMDIPGMMIFFLAICILLWVWMDQDEHAEDAPAALAPALRIQRYPR